MTTETLTPTERIILLDLRYRPNQTTLELYATSGAKELKHFKRTLRTLRLAGYIVATDNPSGDTTFALPAVQR